MVRNDTRLLQGVPWAIEVAENELLRLQPKQVYRLRVSDPAARGEGRQDHCILRQLGRSRDPSQGPQASLYQRQDEPT